MRSRPHGAKSRRMSDRPITPVWLADRARQARPANPSLSRQPGRCDCWCNVKGVVKHINYAKTRRAERVPSWTGASSFHLRPDGREGGSRALRRLGRSFEVRGRGWPMVGGGTIVEARNRQRDGTQDAQEGRRSRRRPMGKHRVEALMPIHRHRGALNLVQRSPVMLH